MSKKKKTGSKSGDVTQKLFVEAGTGIGHEKDGQRRCLGCMELYSEEYEICPYCGYTIEEEVENALHMFPGTVLYDKYIIGRVIGYGGFGVTYLAWDTVLQIKVAIKEYLPSEFSTRAAGQTQITVFSGDKSKQFSDGMEKFIDEAKRLAKFRSENGIVKIFDSFSENGTAYIAMEYLQGETLAERLERDKTIPVEESIQMLMPIIESLNRVHDEGIIHRDIAPDNIFLTNKGEVKLIDFGASRYATTSRSRSLTVIIKPGYSAEEQYRSRGDQGSHTDVYSVGAVLYRMVTGQAPPDAMERRALFEKNGRDMLIPIKKFDKNIDQRRENAIYNALNIRIEDRTPDMITLAGELLSEEPVKKRRSGIKKIDPLTWPLWAKIGIPSGLVAVVALCVLLAFGVIGPKSALGTDHIIPEGQVAIPDIVQKSVEDAQELLRDESLTPKIHDKIESAVIDRNLVLRQDPDALNVVNKGSIVRIIISDGRGMAIMPDVVGLSLEFATQQLEESGFVVATEEEPSEIVARGAVISQDFDPETAVEKGTTVTLKISTGSEKIDRTKKVKVPKIVGMDHDKAVAELKKYHLSGAINNITYNSSIPENQVVGQLPYPNEEAFQGDTVYITVNRKQKMVDVLEYKGKPFDDVAWELREKGLIVESKEVQNEDYEEGRICGQSVMNKSVPVGTKIVFEVSKGFLVKVGNYAGQKQSQAEKALTDLGLEVASVTEYSDTVKKGNVIRHDHANEQVEQGTLITLVVSSGKQPEEGEEEFTQQQQAIGLTNIKITAQPSRTEYYVGDRFDSSGIAVVANYSDSSNKNITSQCKFTGTEFNYKGYSTVTVSYEEGGISKTASFDVKVLEPSVTIEGESTITVETNKSRSLSCATKPEGQTVTWHVEDSSVASVSNGSVTGKTKDGRTSVWATLNYNGKEYTSNKITVFVKDTDVIPEPEKIKIDGGNRSVMVEGSVTVSVTVTPNNLGSKGVVKWSSDKPGVAEVKTVDGTRCEIRGKSPGTATIKATTYDGKLSDTITVTVIPKKVVNLDVQLKKGIKDFAIGEKIMPKDHLNIFVWYEGADNWDDLPSSEYDKIKLDNGGVVSSSHAASQKIKASYTLNGVTVTDEFEITVAASKIYITDKPVNGEISLGKGVSKQLRANVVPTGAEVEWDVTEGSGTVTVDRTTGVVKGIKAGTATVRVRQKNNTGVYDTVRIRVTDKDAVQKIEFKSRLKTKDYYIGETLKKNEIEIWAIKAEGREQIYDFTCSPEKLDSEGSPTITISYAGHTLTETVNVKKPSVEMKTKSVNLNEGEEKEISVEYEPFKSGAKIKWSSSNSVVTVEPKSGSANDSIAVIKGVSGGNATITATITYNDRTYSLTGAGCAVTVKGKEISSINVTGTPSARTQYIGDTFNPAGLTVTANYTNGSTENIPLSKVTFTPDSGYKKITASYGGKTAEIYFSFASPTMKASVPRRQVDANNSTDTIKIATECTPETGWTFDYENLSPEYIDVSTGGYITGKNATPAGTEAKVRVTGTYKGTYKASFEIDGITVKADVTVNEVKFVIDPSVTQKTYIYGDNINTDGIHVEILYSDDTKDNYNNGADLKVELTKGGGTQITPDNSDRGFAECVAIYKDKQGNQHKSAPYSVNVNSPEFNIEIEETTIQCNENAVVTISGDDDISASGYTVKWSPTSSSVVSLNGGKNSVTVTGKSAGTEKVIATLYYGTYELASDSFDVKVVEPDTTPSGINEEYALVPSNEEYGY